VLGDLGCHILDMTSACSEDFVAVRCELKTFPKLVDGKYSNEVNGLALDANDTALIEFELANGGIGISHTTRWATAHGNHLRFEVHGTEGAVCFDLANDYNSIDLCIGEERFSNPWGNTFVTQKLAPTPSNWARFITSIRTGTQDQPDIQRGAVVQSYLDACERSAASGAWEKILNPLV
jgi:predicted dehydrogenase